MIVLPLVFFHPGRVAWRLVRLQPWFAVPVVRIAMRRVMSEVAGCPVSTPPDDLCLYHCISFCRDPDGYRAVPRSGIGHFLGEQASAMTDRARAIRGELVAILQDIPSGHRLWDSGCFSHI